MLIEENKQILCCDYSTAYLLKRSLLFSTGLLDVQIVFCLRTHTLCFPQARIWMCCGKTKKRHIKSRGIERNDSVSGMEPDKLLNTFAFRWSGNKVITYQTVFSTLLDGCQRRPSIDLLTFITVTISDTILVQKVFKRVFRCVYIFNLASSPSDFLK